MLEKILFLAPIIKKLDEGDLFRHVTFYMLNVLGGATAFLGIYFFLTLVREGSFAAVVVGLLQLATFTVVAQVLLVRAQNVHRMGKSEFSVIPIAAVFLTICGEALAALLVGSGATACLVVWMQEGQSGGFEVLLMGFLYSLIPIQTPFFLGLCIFVASLTIAFFVLMFFYLLAESTMVLVSIWRQLHAIRQGTVAQ